MFDVLEITVLFFFIILSQLLALHFFALAGYSFLLASRP